MCSDLIVSITQYFEFLRYGLQNPEFKVVKSKSVAKIIDVAEMMGY